MFKRVNNTILIGIFVILLAIVLLIQYTGTEDQGSIPSTLATIDTSAVTAIHIDRKGSQPLIKLVRTAERWKVQQKGGPRYNADKGMILQALRQLNGLSPKRLAAVDSSKWSNYKVTPEATQVIVKEGDKSALDLYVGKFSFKKRPREMTTFVRLTDGFKVYGVDGMLSMTFKRAYKTWRDNTIIKGDPQQWTKLKFSYPDQSFALQRQNGGWQLDGQALDSTAVQSHLNKLSRLQSNAFLNNLNPDTLQAPYFQLTITRQQSSPITVNAYTTQDTTHEYYISSSQNKGTFFSGNSKGVAEKLMVRQQDLLP